MGRIVVKYRKWILGVAAGLLIPAMVGFLSTRVNYDMLNYLPSETETVQGQEEMLSSFHKGAFSMVITEGLTEQQEAELEAKIRKVEHVDSVVGMGLLTEVGVPAEMLPEEFYGEFNKVRETNEDGSTEIERIMAVFFTTSSSADETVTAVNEIRGILNSGVYVSGMSAFIADLRALSGSEEVMYVVIAVTLATVVMFLLLDNWLAPIVFMVSIGVMILINLGTNIIFGEISYITKALSAILQLAVTMDYSIFLWHAYRENLEQEKSPEAAMEQAIRATLGSVFGSSATTVAGFIALCFMSFTLGLDLGLVMAKGVILGVIGAVTVLPALILTFDRVLRRADHRSLLPNFRHVSKIVEYAPIFLIAFVALIPPFLYGYQKTNENVYYTLSDSLPAEMDFAVANRKLDEDFGLSNVHMILTSGDLPREEMMKMTEELKEVPGVGRVLNLAAVTSGRVPIEMLPEEAVGILKSEKWEMSLVTSEYHTATDEMGTQIKAINEIIKRHDEKAMLVGEAALTEDMIRITSVDFAVVNSVSIVAIFVIILIATRSFTLPVILIMVIEAAIFVNLGMSYFLGERLSFIAPICISTIQLGATVDYAILMTTRYKTERLAGRTSREAAKIALKTSIPSIIVSGAVLFAATIGVAVYSKADMISSLTMLMARGAIISIFAVPLFLAPFLVFMDPIIIRTTMGMKKLVKVKEKK